MSCCTRCCTPTQTSELLPYPGGLTLVRSVFLRHETPPFERHLNVVLALVRSFRQLHLVARHVLAGNQAEKMRNAVQARARRLSSELTMDHGASRVTVASSIMS